MRKLLLSLAFASVCLGQTTATREIHLMELPATGKDFIGFKAADSVASPFTFKFDGTAPAGTGCFNIGAPTGTVFPVTYGGCTAGLPITDMTTHLGHTVISGITNSGGFAQILLGVNESNFGTPDTTYQGGYLQFKADSGALFTVNGNVAGGGTIFPLFAIDPTTGKNFIRDSLYPYSTSGASQLGDGTNSWGAAWINVLNSQEVTIDGSSLTLGSRPLQITGYSAVDSIVTSGGIEANGRVSGVGLASTGNIQTGTTLVGLSTVIDTSQNGFLHNLTLTGTCSGCNTTFPITNVVTYTGHNIPTGITNNGGLPQIVMGVNETTFGSVDTGFPGGYVQLDGRGSGAALFTVNGNAAGGGTIFPLFEIDPSGSNFIRGSLLPYSTTGGGQLGDSMNYWSSGVINIVSSQEVFIDGSALTLGSRPLSITGYGAVDSIVTSGGIEANARVSGVGLASTGPIQTGTTLIGLSTVIDNTQNGFLHNVTLTGQINMAGALVGSADSETGTAGKGKIYFDGTNWQAFEGVTGPTPLLGGSAAYPVLPYFSISHYGAICDGFSHTITSVGLTTANFPHVTSSINVSNAAISGFDEVDWAATMEAIGTAAVGITGLSASSSGGIVQLPRGICMVNKVIDLGNGTAAGNSTYGSITLQGMGMGKTRPGEEDAGTVIVYDGIVSSAKAMIRVNGPVGGIFIRDILLDTLDSLGYAIWSTHQFNGGGDRLTIHHPLVYGIALDAWPAFPTGPGANNNLWTQINVKMIDTCAAGGIRVGGDSAGIDVARTDFR
jgi:hypothetical protein